MKWLRNLITVEGFLSILKALDSFGICLEDKLHCLVEYIADEFTLQEGDPGVQLAASRLVGYEVRELREWTRKRTHPKRTKGGS